MDEAPADKVLILNLPILPQGVAGIIPKLEGWYTQVWGHSHQHWRSFFGMLTWIFGDVKSNEVHVHQHDRAGGFVNSAKQKVKWFWASMEHTLPESAIHEVSAPIVLLNWKESESQMALQKLHTQSYQQILAGNGYGIADTKESAGTCIWYRNKTVTGLNGDHHHLFFFLKTPIWLKFIMTKTTLFTGRNKICQQNMVVSGCGHMRRHLRQMPTIVLYNPRP